MGLSFKPARNLTVEDALEESRGLMSDMGIEDIRVWKDFTKYELIDEFEELYNQTLEFDQKNMPNETLGIIIRWIGWDIKVYNNYDNYRYQKEPENKTLTNFIFGSDEYKKEQFGLTKSGEAICVEDYCVHLANQKKTHVVLF